MTKRCVIIGGAGISDYSRVRSALSEDDYIIYCDCGLRHMDGLGRAPSLIVGDFDSYSDPHLPVETITLPSVKDDTDTMFALKEALRRGFKDFLLIGAVGQRLDHSLGNIAALHMLDTLGLKGRLIDDYSEMQIVSSDAQVDDSFSFFSLLALSGTVTGVNISDAKYELRDAVISADDPYGISNEPLPDKTTKISVGKGRLLLIKIYK